VYKNGSLIFEQIKSALSHLPSVSIVILNWNGKHYLQQFLPSVLATSYPDFKIIVADNASTDGSVAYLTQNFPQVEILIFEQNLGFAKGYNEALKKITADYYVLLNSDVEVTPGWLAPMVEVLQQHESFAACQPKILAYKQKQMFEYAGACGGWIDGFGYPFSRGRVFDICEEDKGQYNDVQEVFWTSGAALLIRRNVFHQVGGFDEFFFAHQEEIDLCWRMQRAGYKSFCCPQSVVYHVGGGTLPRGHSRKTFLNFRNNQIMLWKNLHRREKWWKIPFRIMLDWVSGLKGLLSGDAGYLVSIVKGHLAFVGWLMNTKKVTSTTQKMSLKNYKGVYKGNIAWQHFVLHRNRFSDIVTAEQNERRVEVKEQT
jgi:GT2 family glycosyltransferase